MRAILKKDNFRHLAARQNLSMKTLAERLGVTPQYLSCIQNPEAYDKTLSADRREMLCKILDCEFDDLFVIYEDKVGA
jgi:DNA-binding Xre family transcriptional regulator